MSITYSFGDVIDDDSCSRISIVHGSEGVELWGQQLPGYLYGLQSLHALQS